MLSWKRQDPAYTASLVLEGGVAANLVVLAPASNPKGAVLITKDAEGNPTTQHFPEACAKLRAGDLIEVYCMQERAFGERGFPAPLA